MAICRCHSRALYRQPLLRLPGVTDYQTLCTEIISVSETFLNPPRFCGEMRFMPWSVRGQTVGSFRKGLKQFSDALLPGHHFALADGRNNLLAGHQQLWQMKTKMNRRQYTQWCVWKMIFLLCRNEKDIVSNDLFSMLCLNLFVYCQQIQVPQHPKVWGRGEAWQPRSVAVEADEVGILADAPTVVFVGL